MAEPIPEKESIRSLVIDDEVWMNASDYATILMKIYDETPEARSLLVDVIHRTSTARTFPPDESFEG